MRTRTALAPMLLLLLAPLPALSKGEAAKAAPPYTPVTTPNGTTLPYVPKDARVLSDGAEQPRHFSRSPLMKAARTGSTLLVQRAALRRARLDPRAARAAGGEVPHAR